MRIPEKDRLRSREFQKKNGSIYENSGKRLASSGARFVKPTNNHHKLRRRLREPCARAGKKVGTVPENFKKRADRFLRIPEKDRLRF